MSTYLPNTNVIFKAMFPKGSSIDTVENNYRCSIKHANGTTSSIYSSQQNFTIVPPTAETSGYISASLIIGDMLGATRLIIERRLGDNGVVATYKLVASFRYRIKYADSTTYEVNGLV